MERHTQLDTLIQTVEAMFAEYRTEHGLPVDYDLRSLPVRKTDLTITEFLCPTCDAFTSALGCADHPTR